MKRRLMSSSNWSFLRYLAKVGLFARILTAWNINKARHILSKKNSLSSNPHRWFITTQYHKWLDINPDSLYKWLKRNLSSYFEVLNRKKKMKYGWNGEGIIAEKKVLTSWNLLKREAIEKALSWDSKLWSGSAWVRSVFRLGTPKRKKVYVNWGQRWNSILPILGPLFCDLFGLDWVWLGCSNANANYVGRSFQPH